MAYSDKVISIQFTCCKFITEWFDTRRPNFCPECGEKLYPSPLCKDDTGRKLPVMETLNVRSISCN